MKSLRFRFHGVLFAIGSCITSLGAGVAQLVAAWTMVGTVLFILGLLLIAFSLVQLREPLVIAHDRWDTGKICDAMRRAPDDALIRIRQTWIPEEGFVSNLIDLYVNDAKRFKLDVLLLNPYGPDGDPSPVLAARVALREITPKNAVRAVNGNLSRFHNMKTNISAKSSRRVPIDIEIKLYDHMPFGPIYQIGDDVMYVGFFINFETSSEGPMLEIRNVPGNRWWRTFTRDFDDAWATAEPHDTSGSSAIPQPRVKDSARDPLE